MSKTSRSNVRLSHGVRLFSASANVCGGRFGSHRVGLGYSHASNPARAAATGASRTVALRPSCAPDGGARLIARLRDQPKERATVALPWTVQAHVHDFGETFTQTSCEGTDRERRERTKTIPSIKCSRRTRTRTRTNAAAPCGNHWPCVGGERDDRPSADRESTTWISMSR